LSHFKKGKDKKKTKETDSSSQGSSDSKKTFILVFDGNSQHNWVELFEKHCPRFADGSKPHVVQTSWVDTVAVTEHFRESSTCRVSCLPVNESTGKVKPEFVTFHPDFVLVRNQPRGPSPGSDARKTLYALMSADLPAINSLESCYLDLERPIMFRELKRIEKRVGYDAFPVNNQSLYSHPTQMVLFDSFPAVMKCGAAHAGQGKILLQDMQGFRDMQTVMTLYDDYATMEPFIQYDYGIRVQKVGDSITVMKKNFTGSGWKSHFGGASLEIIPCTDYYRVWAEEASKQFGGIELLAIDAVVDKEGNHFIIELNGSAIGILTEVWAEQSTIIVGLVEAKMNKLLAEKEEEKKARGKRGKNEEVEGKEKKDDKEKEREDEEKEKESEPKEGKGKKGNRSKVSQKDRDEKMEKERDKDQEKNEKGKEGEMEKKEKEKEKKEKDKKKE